jgi:hypothetical protein
VTTWGDAGLLIELLDQQFAYLFKLHGTARLLRLRRVLSFVEGEPQIAGLLQDFRAEADEALREYGRGDSAVRSELRDLWETHRAALQEALRDVRDDALSAHGEMGEYETRLASSTPAAFSQQGVGSAREQETEQLIRAFQHWSKWVSDLPQTDAALKERLRPVQNRLSRVADIHAHSSRRLGEASQGLPWPAFTRLSEHARVTNPQPPTTDDLAAWMQFTLDRRFAGIIRGADESDVSVIDGIDVSAVYESTEHDAQLLHEELRFRVSLGRSRLALVRRYAARCTAFDANRLRDLANQDTGNAERRLTLDFARYLFDQGFTPLIDPTIGGLRPDILDVGGSSVFYAEAKQYADVAPRAGLVKAYKQVWSTWCRLRNQHTVTEAFLVVFRRSGRTVELPPVIAYRGLRLYSAFADIAEDAGSRERLQPVSLDPAELLPLEGDAS